MELQEDNTAMHSQLTQMESRKGKTAELNEKIRKLEHDNKNLEANLSTAESQKSKIQDLKLEAERRNESLRREIDILG